MNKKTRSQIIFAGSILLILFSSLFAAGQGKQSNTNNLITATSVGKVKLGMTIGEARKVLPKGMKLGPADGYEGSTLIGVYEGEKLLFTLGTYDEEGEEGLPPIDEDQRIGVMLIFDSRLRTAAGVHVGMPIAEAEKKYGKLKEIANDPHSGEWGKFTKQPESMEFSFKTKSDVEITVARYERIPNCKITDSSDCLSLGYAPDSYIFVISITE
ncbi:MAG: hypothetical protein KDB79_13710 [Acidobacteria bacterium]|nr:hypothetical protein [Acidobacteriota bacterium]